MVAVVLAEQAGKHKAEPAVAHVCTLEADSAEMKVGTLEADSVEVKAGTLEADSVEVQVKIPEHYSVAHWAAPIVFVPHNHCRTKRYQVCQNRMMCKTL